jgi:hypothetical protein
MSTSLDPSAGTPSDAGACAQCSRPLRAEESIESGGKWFCRDCYASLRAELESAIAGMSTDVNYPKAVAGALLGGAAGALAWWGFTVLTHIAFGLFAVAIGFLAGRGAVMFSGGKRSRGLQAVAIGAAVASYAVATYLVNMTFINQAFASQGEAFRVGLPPQSIGLFARVVSADFGMMDIVFLAIAVWEAWRIPRPLSLPPGDGA